MLVPEVDQQQLFGLEARRRHETSRWPLRRRHLAAIDRSSHNKKQEQEEATTMSSGRHHRAAIHEQQGIQPKTTRIDEDESSQVVETPAGCLTRQQTQKQPQQIISRRDAPTKSIQKFLWTRQRTVATTRSSTAFDIMTSRRPTLNGLLTILLGAGLALCLLSSLASINPAANSNGQMITRVVASMCQYHQTILDNLSKQQQLPPQYKQQLQQMQQANQNSNQHQGLIVCPKSSQHNNLPQQFQANAKHQNANFERHQQALLRSLNESFTNHLQLNGHAQVSMDDQLLPAAASGQSTAAAASLPSDLIDDELLNEIISPVILDEAYQRAKEMIVKRRKLETELIKQGECLVDVGQLEALRSYVGANSTNSRNFHLSSRPTTRRLRHRHEQAHGRGSPPAGHDNNHTRQRAREGAGGFRRDVTDPKQKVSRIQSSQDALLLVTGARDRRLEFVSSRGASAEEKSKCLPGDLQLELITFAGAPITGAPPDAHSGQTSRAQ